MPHKENNNPQTNSENVSESFVSTRGGVFFLAFLTILVVIVISVFVATASSSRISRDARLSADEIADAGMAHAAGILSSLNESDADEVLRAGDGIPGTGDELAHLSADLGSVPIAGIIFGGGRFKVNVSDDAGDDGDATSDSNGVLLVTVDASSSLGERVMHEAEVRIGGVFPAIMTNGPLRLSGSHSFIGDFSYPQTDGMILLDQDLCTETSASDVAMLWQDRDKPNCSMLRAIGDDRRSVSLPAVDVAREFRPLATVILGASGSHAGIVTDGDGRLIHRAGTLQSGGSWSVRGSRWQWIPETATWIHHGSEIPYGAYHSDGNVVILGPLGTLASPAEITLSSEGFIALDGDIHIVPFNVPYIAMAGTDLLLKRSGIASEGYSLNGMLRANDQLGVEGFLNLAGSLVSSNMSDDDSFGCFCNPVPLKNGIQEISIDGQILNEGEIRQPRVRNHQRKNKRPAG